MSSNIEKLDRWLSDQRWTIIWLDKCPEDYEKCKKKFFKNRTIECLKWEFYCDLEEFLRRIRTVDNDESVVIVSSGRLIQDNLQDIVLNQQIHSIYIYCKKIEKYIKWKNDYQKVRGIFDEPVTICSVLGNLCDEGNWIKSSKDENKFVSFDQISILSIPCLIKGQMCSFSPANLCWKVRQCKKVSAKLPVVGQGTIEFRLWKVNRFQVVLSNQQSRNQSTSVDECGILIDVDLNEISLSTIDGRQQGHRTICYRTKNNKNLFPPIKTNDFYRFWISFDYSKSWIRFGFGEVRPLFRVFEQILEENERNLLEKLSFLHFLGDDQQSNTNENDFLTILVGQQSLLFDPPVTMIPSPDFASIDSKFKTGVVMDFLGNSLRDIYRFLQSLNSKDSDLNRFVDQIVKSSKLTGTWCNKKLEENLKTNRSIRIKYDENESGPLKFPLLIEILPTGHHGKICQHCNSSGLIQVVRGVLLVKYFPNGNIDHGCDCSLFEQLFNENSTMWLIPNFNQTFQLNNPDNYDSLCINIQCFVDDTTINSGLNQSLATAIDIDYLSLKEILRQESND